MMTDGERLKGAAHQLRALAAALDDVADRKTYDLRAETLAAFQWFVKIRDSIADIERKARDGEFEPGMESRMPGGTPTDKAKNLFSSKA